MTSNPVWKQFFPSDETQRLHQLLPASFILGNIEDTTYETSSLSEKSIIKSTQEEPKMACIKYPILKPLRPGAKSIVDGKTYFNVDILPWKSSTGAIIIQIGFNSVLNKLSVFDDVLGEVTVPFSKLLQNKNVEGWFRVMDKGSNEMISGPSDNILGNSSHDVSTDQPVGKIDESSDTSHPDQIA
eukprot:CAMPEP_0197839232 /NCGR_PEP_ID=MMETSP1437-20131217/41767_1 /TAXON_ID=49252 ORGANISM="Eucampia antarctica, Strain CCMP1452" /NCGR_SAMPLE_ID=MMETSP1437 /ASSEMBLY_ACC=CAM_ASM_001096 /LENGTH=184 /DNA_ID=CAMNT_0043448083 /DNA_START=1 /DNA_END=552 /DNA_ORIENTATION=-